LEYIKRENLFLSAQLEDFLLPQVMELVGERQIVLETDIPHGDRERFAERLLQERKELSAKAKENFLEHNPARFYGLNG
jgi:predicted TIM-barrel fold metal-dependent hydrolase